MKEIKIKIDDKLYERVSELSRNSLVPTDVLITTALRRSFIKKTKTTRWSEAFLKFEGDPSFVPFESYRKDYVGTTS